jgi:hypothetical protein
VTCRAVDRCDVPFICGFTAGLVQRTQRAWRLRAWVMLADDEETP